MHFHWQIASSVGVLLGIVCIALVLRRLGVLKSEHGGVFADVVLKVTLPALIFNSFVRADLDPRLVLLVAIMLGAQIVCLLLAYVVGRSMKLSRGAVGALMLTSAFGSSGMLGYALVSQAFPGNKEAMTEAAMISEMGVAPLIFTLGIITAIYFGGRKGSAGESLRAVLSFFRSPVFIAMAAGIVCSTIGFPRPDGALKSVFQGLEVLAAANTFMAAMTVGLLLHMEHVKSYAKVAAAACGIKLLLQPMLAWLPMQVLDVSSLHQQVLVIEAGMPAMTLSVVFARKYGCDAQAASIALIATDIVGVGTLLLLTAFLFS